MSEHSASGIISRSHRQSRVYSIAKFNAKKTLKICKMLKMDFKMHINFVMNHTVYKIPLLIKCTAN